MATLGIQYTIHHNCKQMLFLFYFLNFVSIFSFTLVWQISYLLLDIPHFYPIHNTDVHLLNMDFYNFLSNEWGPRQNISGIKVSSMTWTQHGASKSCSDTQRTEGYIDAASYVSAASLNPALVVLAGCLPRPVRRLLARCLPELTAAAVAAARRLTEASVRLGRSPQPWATLSCLGVCSSGAWRSSIWPLLFPSTCRFQVSLVPLLQLPADRTHLLVLTLTSPVSLLARNISGALAVARGTWSRAHLLFAPECWWFSRTQLDLW